MVWSLGALLLFAPLAHKVSEERGLDCAQRAEWGFLKKSTEIQCIALCGVIKTLALATLGPLSLSSRTLCGKGVKWVKFLLSQK